MRKRGRRDIVLLLKKKKARHLFVVGEDGVGLLIFAVGDVGFLPEGCDGPRMFVPGHVMLDCSEEGRKTDRCARRTDEHPVPRRLG